MGGVPTTIPIYDRHLNRYKKAKIGIILHKLKSNYVEKRHLETNDYNKN